MKKLLLAFALIVTLAAPASALGGGVVSILKCKPGPVLQVDPILAPGGALSEHMHQFFGGSGIQPEGIETTVAGMEASPSTCPLSGDTAGYWVPTLHDANHNVIVPTQLNVYYRSPVGKRVVAYPEGFGIVCPSSACKVVTTQGGSGWGCTDTEGLPTIHAALPCPKVLIGHVQLKPFDPTLPKVAIHARYAITSGTGYHLSSDDARGTSSGQSLHADFWNTWNQSLLARVIATLNQGKACRGMTDATVSCLVNI
jgi:hypothetical protein